MMMMMMMIHWLLLSGFSKSMLHSAWATIGGISSDFFSLKGKKFRTVGTKSSFHLPWVVVLESTRKWGVRKEHDAHAPTRNRKFIDRTLANQHRYASFFSGPPSSLEYEPLRYSRFPRGASHSCSSPSLTWKHYKLRLPNKESQKSSLSSCKAPRPSCPNQFNFANAQGSRWILPTQAEILSVPRECLIWKGSSGSLLFVRSFPPSTLPKLTNATRANSNYVPFSYRPCSEIVKDEKKTPSKAIFQRRTFGLHKRLYKMVFLFSLTADQCFETQA